MKSFRKSGRIDNQNYNEGDFELNVTKTGRLCVEVSKWQKPFESQQTYIKDLNNIVSYDEDTANIKPFPE